VTTNQTDRAVNKTVSVNLPAERAFALFTQGMATWWPESHHLGGVPAAMILEPRAGGRIYDRYDDGRELDWASVRDYEPPERIVIRWHLGGDWAFDPDPAHASTVEVRFFAESPTTTRVELEHRDFANHVHGGDEIRSSVDSPEGWILGLNAFVSAGNAA
jgi:uncharacterized protein YndB with AHSA1/START domain